MKNNNRFAIITGATGGVGKAFSQLLAMRGYTLFLTGRSNERLQAFQRFLTEKYAANVYFFAADLSDANQSESLFEEILKKTDSVDLLVNVAGVDIQKAFVEYTQEKIVFQSRVNFEAAVSLCHFSIKNKAEKLEIINISSVSGFYPMPYFAIYSATKNALTSFSVSLREEMKGKNVRVTAVLPGAMPTRDDIKEQIKGQGLWGKLAAKSPLWVAEKSLRAVSKNKAKYIPGGWNKAMRISTAWIPNAWRLKFIAKRWSKISKDAF